MHRIHLLVHASLFSAIACASDPPAAPRVPQAPKPTVATAAAPEPTAPPAPTDVARTVGPCANLPAGFTPVHFELDSYHVDARYLNELEEIAACLKHHPEAKLRIEGHADERGTPEYNLALGEQRARRVEATLEDLGVDSSRVQTTSFGEERPAMLGTGEDVWSQNRRAELRVTQP